VLYGRGFWVKSSRNLYSKNYKLKISITSLWFRKLINLFEVIGNRGYKGYENVEV